MAPGTANPDQVSGGPFEARSRLGVAQATRLLMFRSGLHPLGACSEASQSFVLIDRSYRTDKEIKVAAWIEHELGFGPARDVVGALTHAVVATLDNDRILQLLKIPIMAAAQVSKAVPVETQHEDMIHDAQLDYYGKRLATGSSDKTIRIFNVVKGEAKGEPIVLKGHTAPVWQVVWAHPSFGSILASCSYDGRVFIWKEVGKGQGAGSGGEVQDGWERIKEHTLHSASVNSIAWAPFELGPILACASSDGKISVLSFQNDGSTDAVIFNAHGSGANTISWAPSVLASSSGQNKGSQPGQQVVPQKRFVSGGSDNAIRIWAFDETAKKWVEEEEIKGHDNWVRDVAWGPNIGLPGQYIASASQDRTVLIHTRPSADVPWESTALRPNAPESDDPHFPDAVWRVSWSIAGNILAVSCGDGKVSLWKEGVGKGWECVSDFSS